MHLIQTSVSAGITGFESPANDFIDLPLSLDSLLISRKSSVFFGLASGDSMTGFGIFDGDLLIIDRAEPVKSVDIVIACLNGELVCKQWHKDLALLVSGNDQYKAVRVRPEDEFVIEGVLIHSVRLFRRPAELRGI